MARGFEGLPARVDALIEATLGEERLVGAVVIVMLGGETIYRRTAGWMDREAKVPMREDAIFRLASLTKPIVATTALAMMDRGLLGLDDSVTDHLPYFMPTWEGRPARITVRQLLTHTSGLSYDPVRLAEVDATGGMAGPIIPLEENVRRIGQMRLKFEPGTGWEYGVSIEVLGCVIASINGSSLDEAIQRYVTGPLGMTDTRFGVTDASRLAVPYANAHSGPPVRMRDTHQGIDPITGAPGPVFCPSRIFNPLAPQCGGSGMASSGPDFIRLIETYCTGGATLLRPETVAAALDNQIGDIPWTDPRSVGCRFGLIGRVIMNPVANGAPVGPRSANWGGVYGHHWSVDRANGLAYVAMSNTALEGSDGRFRPELRTAIYGA